MTHPLPKTVIYLRSTGSIKVRFSELEHPIAAKFTLKEDEPDQDFCLGLPCLELLAGDPSYSEETAPEVHE